MIFSSIFLCLIGTRFDAAGPTSTIAISAEGQDQIFVQGLCKPAREIGEDETVRQMSSRREEQPATTWRGCKKAQLGIAHWTRTAVTAKSNVAPAFRTFGRSKACDIVLAGNHTPCLPPLYVRRFVTLCQELILAVDNKRESIQSKTKNRCF